MNPYAFVSLFSFIVAFFLGNFIYYKNPNNRLNQLIALLCLLVAYLSFVEFGLRQSETYSTAYLWSKATFLWPIMTPLLLNIVLIVTKRYELVKNKIFLFLLYLPSIIISMVSLFTNQVSNGLLPAYWGWTTNLTINSPILYLSIVWIIALGLASIILSFKYYQKSKGLEKIQTLYIFIGLTMVLILSLITELILPFISVDFPEITYISATMGLLFIAYGVSNYRLPSLTPALAANEIVTYITNFLVLTDCKKQINYINPAGLKLLGYTEGEIRGRDVDIILPDKGDLEPNDLTLKDYTKDFETILKSKSGETIPILLSTSYISKKSANLGILYMGTDIRKRKAIEMEKRAVAKQTIDRQSILLEMYKEDISDLENTLKNVTETVAKALDVDRVGVWFFNNEKTVLKLSDLYILQENRHEKDLLLDSDDYPVYIDAIRKSHNITAEDAMIHPDTKEFKDSYLIPEGIQSMMDVPIWLQGDMVGVLCHEQTRNMKKWTFEEQDFAASTSYIISLSLEATEREEAQKQIVNSLEEKNVLLREIHHRVKNNMQIISSLLSLQSSNIEDQNMRDIFNESQNRVKSMSMIHEQLYQTDDLAKIDFKIYVNGLIKNLFQIFSPDWPRIRWVVDIDKVKLNLESAIPCGLIINELVSNSLKHAFKEGSDGNIMIKMRKNGETITLIISDNGVGFPKDFNIEKTSTLGLKLVKTLVNQLEGEMVINTENGTTYEITLKEINYEKRV
jgi:PAS domain S-box-containing protein